MSSRVVLLVIFIVGFCNGIPSAEIPDVEITNANEKPVLPKAGPAWVPMSPIVESATEMPLTTPSPATIAPPPVTTESPVEAITAGAEVDNLVPIVGKAHFIERVAPIAA